MEENSRPSQRAFVKFGRGTLDVTEIENIRQLLRELVTGIGEEPEAWFQPGDRAAPRSDQRGSAAEGAASEDPR